jgi:hypothetical protein
VQTGAIAVQAAEQSSASLVHSQCTPQKDVDALACCHGLIAEFFCNLNALADEIPVDKDRRAPTAVDLADAERGGLPPRDGTARYYPNDLAPRGRPSTICWQSLTPDDRASKGSVPSVIRVNCWAMQRDAFSQIRRRGRESALSIWARRGAFNKD